MDDWRKSSRSDANGGACVEVGTVPNGVAVRDTTDRNGVTLSVPASAWAAFITRVLVATPQRALSSHRRGSFVFPFDVWQQSNISYSGFRIMPRRNVRFASQVKR